MNQSWMLSKGQGIKVAIVDSGINHSHPEFAGRKLSGIKIVRVNDELSHNDDIEDHIGHGTGVTSIIHKLVPESDLFIIKIFDNDDQEHIDKLMYALQYIISELDCDIVHLSLGVSMTPELDQLRKLCNQITGQGKIVISAFHHNGSLSFPASFPNVIGVEVGMDCKKEDEFEFIESQSINILAKGTKQKLPSLNSDYNYIEGSSFAAARITGNVAKIMSCGTRQYSCILDKLRESAGKIHHVQSPFRPNKWEFAIKKAVVFPYNKEIHSLIRFSDLLPFELSNIYDSRYSGYVNSKTSDLLGTASLPRDYIVENISNLNWDSDFDTFILGHVKEKSKQHNFDYASEMMDKCIQYNKKLFCFDPAEDNLNMENSNMYFPKVDIHDVPALRKGKLRDLGKPVIGIFGTSSMQGKFTLQLKLRKTFMNEGYKVGQLGTEPSSLLFGFDQVYPMGYESAVSVKGHEAIHVINHLMGQIEDTNPDVIIVGSQANTIPKETTNLMFYTPKQIEFLLGTQPDVIILMVNPEDDLSYIKRSIGVLENLSRGKVIGLVLFPARKIVTMNNLYQVKQGSDTDLENIKTQMESELKKVVYSLSEDQEINKLYNAIVDFLS